MTVPEIISLVASRRSVSEDDLRRTHSLEQILLKRHFDLREDKRLMDYEAAMVGLKVAQLLVKAFP